MAAKTGSSTNGVQYHVANPDNDHVVIGGVRLPVTGVQVLRIVEGGNIVTLSQQNITDLLPAFTAFSNTGVWS